MIRLETGDVVFPPVNLCADFVESCKQHKVIGEEGKLTRYIVSENLEYVLQKRSEERDRERSDDSFQLGQILFEKGSYSQALVHFKDAVLRYDDPRAKYQIGVMLFDDLLEGEDLKQFENPQRAAFYMMQGLLSLDRGVGSPLGNAELVDAAAFNLYLAYLQGWGVEQSDEIALKYLQIAATNGDTKVSVMAQTTMGYFYSSADHMDLSKAFYWHSEACQNGSVESQAVLGVLHMFGLGSASKDWGTALNCLRDASERGSVYATGMLSFLYFRRALYTVASRTAYSLVGNTELRNSLMVDTRNGGGSGGGGSGRGIFDIQARCFIQRGLTVACFIYATCLDRGLGLQQDRGIASTMYSRVSSHRNRCL
ncbi:LRP2-binding protein [Echinococcus granulosus]|uniref:LRP2-binding protein n=1 Tax=Echinococcus granulosus TaxID=6210 RepID=W6UGJ0_ECHGR|nr:LRP2-binding protein [Echinococcus granulosus]EUB60630.1 LRP2-binding protein [Echinococcus granulosus]